MKSCLAVLCLLAVSAQCRIPTKRIAHGVNIPMIGLGTCTAHLAQRQLSSKLSNCWTHKCTNQVGGCRYGGTVARSREAHCRLRTVSTPSQQHEPESISCQHHGRQRTRPWARSATSLGVSTGAAAGCRCVGVRVPWIRAHADL